LGFDGDTAKNEVEEIFANDKHLADCCANLLNLANFLDSFFITAVADAKSQGAAKERLDFAYEEFEPRQRNLWIIDTSRGDGEVRSRTVPGQISHSGVRRPSGSK
jgi:hypothetical protein